MSVSDQTYMELALRLGRRNRGATAENPSVGCVIVAGDAGAQRIVGRGWTQAGGRPHAEAMALEQAGSAARGATAYVTLEPCAHHGRTPPCADSLVGAGIARVVVALDDPDPRVNGQGFSRLAQAGVVVETGMCAARARSDLAGFLSRIERGRPYVTLKLAVSGDGKIAQASGQTTVITGPEARARGHLIRARSDAILVGKNTVLTDDPVLTCRLPGLEAASPLRVVLDSSLAVPVEARLLEAPVTPEVWIYCGENASPDKMQALSRAGATVIPLAVDGVGRPNIELLLSNMAQRGLNDLMVEGGAQVAEAFVKADMVDRVALFSSRDTVGADGLDALNHLSLGEITDGSRFVHAASQPVGEDMLDWYARKE